MAPLSIVLWEERLNDSQTPPAPTCFAWHAQPLFLFLNPHDMGASCRPLMVQSCSHVQSVMWTLALPLSGVGLAAMSTPMEEGPIIYKPAFRSLLPSSPKKLYLSCPFVLASHLCVIVHRHPAHKGGVCVRVTTVQAAGLSTCNDAFTESGPGSQFNIAGCPAALYWWLVPSPSIGLGPLGASVISVTGGKGRLESCHPPPRSYLDVPFLYPAMGRLRPVPV